MDEEVQAVSMHGILHGLSDVLTSLEKILRADHLSCHAEHSVLMLINEGFELCQAVVEIAPDLSVEANRLHRRFWFVAGSLEQRSPEFEYVGALGGHHLVRRPILSLCH